MTAISIPVPYSRERGRTAYEAISRQLAELDYEKARRQLAWSVEEWPSYVLAHPFDTQPQALARVFEHLSRSPIHDPAAKLAPSLDPELIALARSLWTGRAIGTARPFMVWILRVLSNSGIGIMTPAEEEALSALPRKLALWRGFTDRGGQTDVDIPAFARGCSWSTDHAAALSFAHQNPLVRGYLARTIAPRALIDAYFCDDPHREAIVLWPERLMDITIAELS